MKALVTGASGSLGGRLCHGLLKQGHSVRALVRRTSDISELPPPSTGGAFELAYGDITDCQSLLDAFSGCQVIFHAAAIVEPWLPDPSKFFSVNVEELNNVLQAAKETETIAKIIYTSSFFALGSTDGYAADENQGTLRDLNKGGRHIFFNQNEPVTADFKPLNMELENPFANPEEEVHCEKRFCMEYKRSKMIADKIASQAAAEGGADRDALSWCYLPFTSGNIVAQLLIERFAGRLPGYIGYGNDKFSFVHVDDVVDGHIAAMDKGRQGERYLLTGENASFKLVFDMAAIISETKKPRFSIPLWIIESYGWVLVLVSLLTGNLPLISPPTVHVLRHQWAYSCEKAKTELGYNPRSLEEGLKEVLPWLKSLGVIKY